MDGQNNASQTYDTARAVQRKQRYPRFFTQRDSAAFRIDLVVVSEIAVVLDLMHPAGTCRRLVGAGGDTRRDVAVPTGGITSRIGEDYRLQIT